MADILAIDAGNTRVKWGLFNAEGIMLEHGACLHCDLANIGLPEAPHIVISNVAGTQIKAQLAQILPKNISINWINAQAAACGVTNSYEQPKTLGTDRWAALVAAWYINNQTSIVVNAGTAITIDVLNEAGIFLGGTIMPGLRLMHESLRHNTANLAVDFGEVKPFPINTQDAITTGCMNATLGAILITAERLQAHYNSPPAIIITGGNAVNIKENLINEVTKQAIIVDNLVLQGLYLLEKWIPQTIKKSEPQ
jgi:type III pantothenate kinase